MGKYLIIIATFVVVLATSVFGTYRFFRPRMEGQLTRHCLLVLGQDPVLRRSLAEGSLEVSVQGRDLFLKGKTRSRRYSQLANTLINRTRPKGLRKIFNSLEVPKLSSLEVIETQGTTRISGVLPSKSAVDLLLRSVGKTAGINNETTVNADLPSPRWLPPLSKFLPRFLRYTEGARLIIEEEDVTISGVVVGERNRENLSLIIESIRSAGLNVQDQLSVKAAPFFALREEEGVISLNGDLNSEESKKAIVRAVKTVLPGAKVNEEQIRIDSGIANAPWMTSIVEILELFLPNAEKPFLRVLNNEMTIGGQIPDASKYDSIVSRIEGLNWPEGEIVSAIIKGRIRELPSENENPENGEGRVDVEGKHIDDPITAPSPISTLDGLPQDKRVELEQLLKNAIVYFESGESSLDSDTKEKLSATAKRLMEYPSMKIVCGGFADASGNAQLNRELSKKRAGAVSDALVEAGVVVGRISTRIFEAQPVSPENDTPESRRLSRRVELSISE